MSRLSSRSRRGLVALMLALSGIAASACVYNHGPSSYSFGDSNCTEIKPKQKLWHGVNGGACAVFKVSDSTFVSVLVKATKHSAQGTLELWAASGHKKAEMIEERDFRVSASPDPQVIASGVLSGADKKTYVVRFIVPEGTPKFSYTIAIK